MAFLLRAFGKLPLPVLYVLGRLIAVMACDVLRWHRALAAANIARALPDRTAAQQTAILRQCYRNLGEAFAEACGAGRRRQPASSHASTSTGVH